ncbi:hypothetical protein JCM10449v2_007014 [Rhodotorula kratochvilovae]
MLPTLALAALAAAPIVAAVPLSSSSSSPAASLVVVPRGQLHAEQLSGCATYHGTVGAQHLLDVYHLSAACASLAPFAAAAVTGESIAIESTDTWTQPTDEQDLTGALVWLHPTILDVDPTSLRAGPDPVLVDAHSAQLAFSAPADFLLAPLSPGDGVLLPHGEGRLLRLSTTSQAHALAQLAHLSSHPSFAHFSPVVLSRTPVALAGDDRFPTVPESAVRRVEKHLDGLRFDPLLSSLVASLGSEKSVERMKKDVRTLSGEDQSRVVEDERWVSRHSMSEGGFKASNWVFAKMSTYGFTCTQLAYLPSFAPMVECVYDESGLGEHRDDSYAASPVDDITFGANETVVLSAHFDSRGSFGYPTAPGADDDASGTTLVLAVARHIFEHRLRFGRKLVLCLFSGEEQGLLSSSFYAKRLRARGEDVAFALQVDMVGYRKPGEPMQLARPDVIGLPQAGHLVGNVSEVYVPELVVGYTPACCSDHQSFVTEAYPATWIFERNGAIADPCYHDSCDLSAREGYDFEQIAAHAKVAFAVVWETAGGALP